jgi:hypothetical protein
MSTADYLVLLLVVAAYLGWIFQGDRNIKPRKPYSED